MQESDGKFTTGFLLGAIIGASIVFLFGTRKGKKLLDIISEDGLEGILNLEEEKIEEEIEDKTPRKIAAPKIEIPTQEVREEEIRVEQDIMRKPIRRFFRGAKPL